MSGICDITYFEDKIKLSATTDKRKAEVLASFFSSVFTNEPSSDVTPSISYVETISLCDKILFNHDAVYNILFNLLPFKLPGPEYLHPFVLKFAIIFQTSLDTMSLPYILDAANVSSIFREGDWSDPSYYRPISLTCVAFKLMESIIKDVY